MAYLHFSVLRTMTAIAMTLAVVACASEQDSPVTTISTDVPAVPVVAVEAHATQGEGKGNDLESRVSALEQQMATATPTLKKIDLIENHFKALALDLDRITAQAGVIKEPAKMEQKQVPVSSPAPIHKATPKSPVEKVQQEKASQDKGLVVSGVRMGAKTGGMTRIVLDTSSPAEIHYDLDNGEHLLIVDVPGAKWNAVEEGNFTSVPLVSSFKAQSDATGSRLIIQLKGDAKVTTTARVNPSKDQGHRVYLDLAPLK